MKKILIVDDAEIVRIDLRHIFENNGFEVVEACNGMEGVAVAQAHPNLDVIVTVFNMPNMNGLEMIEKIRLIPGKEKTPVMVFSAQSIAESKEKAKSLNVSAWVLKPHNPTSLLSIVNKLCAAAAAS